LTATAAGVAASALDGACAPNVSVARAHTNTKDHDLFTFCSLSDSPFEIR
jgi:hypothetical protein